MYLFLLKVTLSELGIFIKKSHFTLDVRPLLKLVLPQFFGNANGFVDMVVKHIPSPVASARLKVSFLQLNT